MAPIILPGRRRERREAIDHRIDAPQDELDALARGTRVRRPVRVSARCAWRGADARGWLHDLVTCDVATLEPGVSRRSLLLSPTGTDPRRSSRWRGTTRASSCCRRPTNPSRRGSCSRPTSCPPTSRCTTHRRAVPVRDPGARSGTSSREALARRAAVAVGAGIRASTSWRPTGAPPGDRGRARDARPRWPRARTASRSGGSGTGVAADGRRLRAGRPPRRGRPRTGPST